MKKSEKIGNIIGNIIGFLIVVGISAIIVLILAWGARLAYRLLVSA